jgi:hypothetical protein
VTSTITDLILNSIALHANLNDTFAIINAAFIAALYTVIGLEFGKFS